MKSSSEVSRQLAIRPAAKATRANIAIQAKANLIVFPAPKLNDRSSGIISINQPIKDMIDTIKAVFDRPVFTV
jgi:hypothetical protein